ncbi:threonine-phosphate decarboxylase CobD [Novosphingobium rosa]|uniref:threonine-phosphate decarboxylase CobD n=1 Tax=Novosphingobium rosa TaxID=76978 RepID=UPI0008366C42|nr:threonine-phosphate decarboxylase CobD [Novosphingobium rosa]
MRRDHGGDLDRARASRGGDDWIDLSTGINRVPYPVPPLPPEAWTALPTASARDALLKAAAQAYRTPAPMVALAGAQAAIQMLPMALGAAGGTVRVLSPTYNEHAACFTAAGFMVEPVSDPGDLAGGAIAVVVNPNNPDGRLIAPADLLALRDKVGLLVVDESFADPLPEMSLAPHAGEPGLVVLRSFGKFYGLAGVRLGFALGDAQIIARLTAMAGPWPVAGPALEIGATALQDAAWARATTRRLVHEVGRIDALTQTHGWTLVGGTHLFRLYDTPGAAAAQDHLADHRIWSRIFPWSSRLIRLGLPGMESEWRRLAAAFGQAD